MQIGIDSFYVTRKRVVNALTLAPVLFVLSGCGGGSNDAPTPMPTPTPSTYSVTGTVTGLTGAGLVLASGGNVLSISAAGAQTFATALANGASYGVTVTTQPNSPNQTCSVMNGSGTVAAANVTNVSVTCVTNTYMVGVTVSGLAAATNVVLQNNAANDLTVSTNVAANFTTAIASGAAYNVTVRTQPINPNQICTVMNGSGTVVSASVNATVTCVTAPLTITSIAPASNATNVSRSISPALNFSAALNATTLTPSNITLTSVASNVSAVSAITAGATASALNVVTAARLLPATQYTLTVTGGIRGQFNESLASAVTSQFTTRDGAWGTAGLIETDNAGFAATPEIAFDGSGNALAVWFQSDGSRYNIWSNRYVVGSGWGTATLIESDNTGDAYSPEIGFDANGNALAVWRQSDGSSDNIWSNRYVVGSGWGTAVQIETEAGQADSHQISVDRNGNALAVWSQHDGTRFNNWANRYTAGSGWSTATLIETDDVTHAAAPQIAMDASGNALTVWRQSDGLRQNIWSNRYTVGSGWGVPALIESSAGSADEPQIAIDAGGNALVVWYQRDNMEFNVWSNRYVVGSGWGTAGPIETNAGDAYSPKLAMNANGNAVAVWSQDDGTRHNIWSNRYTAGSGWGTAALIETDNASQANAPQIAMDASGNALAVWVQSDGTRYNVWSNRYVAGNGWGTAALIESDNADGAEEPQIAMDASGNALAVWSQSDGTRQNIVSNRFE